MSTIVERIKAQEDKLKQLKALHAKQEAQKRAAESKKARKEENRKKILLGAMVLEQMNRDAAAMQKMMEGMNRFLKRDDERAVFGFAPLPKAQPETPAAATVNA